MSALDPRLSSRYDIEMVADLVRLAHEHATAPHFEAAVLEWLGAHVGFDVGFFSVKGDEAFPTVSGLPPELVQRAVRRGPTYYQELLPVKEAALRAHGVAVDTDVLGERRVHQAAYYRELARRVGGRHSLMAYVPLRGRVVAGIMLGRCGAAFSSADVARVEAVLPALGVARSSYGLPVRFDPLTSSSRGRRGFLGRLGLGGEPAELASSALGDTIVSVRDRGGFREMVASAHGAELIWTRAALRDPSESGWPYVDLFHLAAVQARARQRALFVGCGGAVALRQFARVYPGLQMDLVERERSVIELARSWYDLDAIPGLSVHVADGAEFVEGAAPASWDIVVVDAFDASEAASTLTRRPFLSALYRSLCPGGALGMNVIGTLDGPGPVRSLVDALRSSFDSVRMVPVLELDEAFSGSALRNVVVVATRKR